MPLHSSRVRIHQSSKMRCFCGLDLIPGMLRLLTPFHVPTTLNWYALSFFLSHYFASDSVTDGGLFLGCRVCQSSCDRDLVHAREG